MNNSYPFYNQDSESNSNYYDYSGKRSEESVEDASNESPENFSEIHSTPADPQAMKSNLPEKQSNTIKIVLLGTNGCGKTVLLTMLWDKYHDRNSYWFRSNQRDSDYLSSVLQKLKKQEFPKSTEPGQRYQITLTLMRRKKQIAELQIWDIAGQDFRQIYGGNQQNEYFEELRQHCEQADVVFALIKTNDANDTSTSRNTQDLNFYWNALEGARHKQGPQAIVFTQCDRNPEVMKDARHYLGTQFVNVYDQYAFMKNIPILAVSAVEGFYDKDNHMYCPQTPIISLGIDVFFQKLLKEIQKVKMQRQNRGFASRTASFLGKTGNVSYKFMLFCCKHWKYAIVLPLILLTLLILIMSIPSFGNSIMNMRRNLVSLKIQKCDRDIANIQAEDLKLSGDTKKIQEKIALTTEKLLGLPNPVQTNVLLIPSCVPSDKWYAYLFGFCKEHKIVVKATIRNNGAEGSVEGECQIRFRGTPYGKAQLFENFTENEEREVRLEISQPDFCYTSHSEELTYDLTLKPSSANSQYIHLVEMEKYQEELSQLKTEHQENLNLIEKKRSEKRKYTERLRELTPM